jgi:hypothetical protein
MNTSLTQIELKTVLSYDPSSGVFRWRNKICKRVVPGTVAGWKSDKGYIKITLHGVDYFAHRLAWLYMTGAWPNDVVDHRDGQRDNNRWTNLRDTTHQENMQNRTRCWNQTGLMGAFKRTGRAGFFSVIKRNGAAIYLGNFPTAEQAHEAYLKAKAAIHPFATIALEHADQRRAA